MNLLSENDYKHLVDHYASQPWWLYEVGKLLAITRDKCIGGEVLDVGCNGGDMAALFSTLTRAEKVYGIDVNATAVRMGSKFYPHLDLRAMKPGDVYPFEGSKFDVLVSLHTLGHIEKIKHALDEMLRVLKPGGRIAAVIPNRDYYRLRYIGRTPPGDVTQVHEWNPAELEDLFWDRGFAVDHVEQFGRVVPFAPWVKARILLEGHR